MFLHWPTFLFLFFFSLYYFVYLLLISANRVISFWPNRRQCKLYSNSHSFWLISFAIYESFTHSHTPCSLARTRDCHNVRRTQHTHSRLAVRDRTRAGVLPRCHCPCKKSFTILRTACVHCPLCHPLLPCCGSVRLVLVPIHWGALSLEPRATSWRESSFFGFVCVSFYCLFVDIYDAVFEKPLNH